MTWKPASRRSDHQYRTQFIHDQAIFEKDGMTWDEIISLARKHTRSDGGVNYHGMVLGDFGVMKSML